MFVSSFFVRLFSVKNIVATIISQDYTQGKRCKKHNRLHHLARLLLCPAFISNQLRLKWHVHSFVYRLAILISILASTLKPAGVLLGAALPSLTCFTPPLSYWHKSWLFNGPGMGTDQSRGEKNPKCLI